MLFSVIASSDLSERDNLGLVLLCCFAPRNKNKNGYLQ
jgi:hypothetical protein